MKNSKHSAIHNQSPWLDPTKSNLIRDQFKLIEEINQEPEIQNGHPYFEPLEIFKWIYTNNGVDKLYKALAQLAPMDPVVSYEGKVASWISPPPSGAGNVVWIVIGHDKTGKLRVCGSNVFSKPWVQSVAEIKSVDFFDEYDSGTATDKQQLLSKVISQCYRQIEKEFIADISRRCRMFSTMPIYITVLTETGCMSQITEAVIQGDSPSDFSYEFTGEIS